VVCVEGVTQRYRMGRGDVAALSSVSLEVEAGTFAVVRGPSGSGKTTLLLAVGGMLEPTEGRVVVDGCDLYAMHARGRAIFRAEHIGFVFQMYHLIPYLNVVENVLLPSGVGQNRAGRAEARALLDRLHLLEREHHMPSELSAGERQRTAVARALLNRPALILADEPTGNLDADNAEEIVGHLSAFCRDGGTVVMATHGTAADACADCRIFLREGRMERMG